MARERVSCTMHLYTAKETRKEPSLANMFRNKAYNVFDRVCKKGIRKAWGQGQFTEASHFIFSTYDEKTRRGGTRAKMCGFALIKNDPTKDYLYVDILCSDKGQGRIILRRAEQLAKDLGKRKVNLKALQPVINWYHDPVKNGYRHVDDGCDFKEAEVISGNTTDGFRMSKCLPDDDTNKRKFDDGDDGDMQNKRRRIMPISA